MMLDVHVCGKSDRWGLFAIKHLLPFSGCIVGSVPMTVVFQCLGKPRKKTFLNRVSCLHLNLHPNDTAAPLICLVF